MHSNQLTVICTTHIGCLVNRYLNKIAKLRADRLALLCVMFLVFLSLLHVVSLVRCGILLYQFLIRAFFLTFNISIEMDGYPF